MFSRVKEKITSGIKRFFTPPNVDDIEMQLAELKEKKSVPVEKVHFSLKNIVVFWFMGMVFVLIGYYLFNFLNTLFVIVGAYIISIIMEGPIHYFEKKKFRRGLAITVSYIILVLFTLLCVIFLSPLIIDQVAGLITWLGQQLSYLQTLFSTTPLSRIVADQSRIPEMIKGNILSSLQHSS